MNIISHFKQSLKQNDVEKNAEMISDLEKETTQKSIFKEDMNNKINNLVRLKRISKFLGQ